MAGKGNDPAENLNKYTRMSSNESAVDTGQNSQGKDLAKIYADLTNEKAGVSYHKSLDFSNVGMPTDPASGVAFLRQFHQTRLYIMDYGGILSHSDNVGNLKNNITSTYLISSNLPERFSYSIGSKWSQPFHDFAPAQMNAFFQLGGGQLFSQAGNALGLGNIGDNIQSTSARISTLQVWNGTEPLRLTLEIPVIDDGHPNESSSSVGLRTNLVEALEFLGSLCLPKSVDSAFGFYQPPPSPYQFSYTWNGSTSTYSGNHARIMLQLGGMLLVDNVIIEGISVSYPNTKAQIRHWYQNKTNPGVNVGASTYLTPLLATITIKILTSEALTANTYSNMLWLKQQAGQGSFSVDVDEAVKTVKSGASSIANAGIGFLNSMTGGKFSELTGIKGSGGGQDQQNA